ncbi:MAG: hypothetical protein IPI73_02515 [Betaproteobacteria bacterium]|nr:hypothetical protein [Betaproteobacteria bacterium]
MNRGEADGLRALETTQRAADAAAGRPFLGWQYEGQSFAASPGADGLCTSPLVPLYRMYNGRAAMNDSNHRFAVDPAIRQGMLAQGWSDEGVAMCVQVGDQSGH